MIDTDNILETCREYGLDASDARLTNGLLELVPRNLQDLPDSASLQRLAEVLKGGEVRWVTLAVEEAR